MAKQNTKLAEVFHFDLQGKREAKYDFLLNNSLHSIPWNELKPDEPNYFLVKKDFGNEDSANFFHMEELFGFYSSGLTTEFDELAIQENFENSKVLLAHLKTKDCNEIEKEYQFGQSKLIKINSAIKDVLENVVTILPIYYRPFDNKSAIYTGKINGIMGRPRNDLMKHFSKQNLGLIIGRQGQAVGSMPWNVLTITNTIVDSNIFYRGRGTVFPIYLYPDTNAQQTIDQQTERTPNLNPVIVQQIADNLGMTFINEKATSTSSVSGSAIEPVEMAPIDLLDYIYAVLHSPTYREKYKEFLKIDFPRVPYPKDAATFWQLVKLGGEIRTIHLLESPVVEQYITQYPVDGDNEVGKVRFEGLDLTGFKNLSGLGRVYINDTQYFDNVPETAWNFYIGGYQPAQKWLKDRKGRKLEFDDIMHYQKIIVALTETERLMKEIDNIEIE
jgi:predicted helicase